MPKTISQPKKKSMIKQPALSEYDRQRLEQLKIELVHFYVKKLIRQKYNQHDIIRYQFCILENNILFCIDGKNHKLLNYILYDLYSLVKKRLNLRLCILLPDPISEFHKMFKDFKFEWKFDLYDSVDVYYSIALWEVFGKRYTIRAFSSHFWAPSVRENETPEESEHKKIMEEHGYNSVLGDSHGIDSWADYATAYQKAYGLPTIDITTHSGFVEV